MNEKIKQLAEHCDFYVGNEHSDKPHQEKQLIWTEKLAELIINECIDIANNTRYEGKVVANRIKFVFGVE